MDKILEELVQIQLNCALCYPETCHLSGMSEPITAACFTKAQPLRWERDRSTQVVNRNFVCANNRSSFSLVPLKTTRTRAAQGPDYLPWSEKVNVNPTARRPLSETGLRGSSCPRRDRTQAPSHRHPVASRHLQVGVPTSQVWTARCTYSWVGSWTSPCRHHSSGRIRPGPGPASAPSVVQLPLRPQGVLRHPTGSPWASSPAPPPLFPRIFDLCSFWKINQVGYFFRI